MDFSLQAFWIPLLRTFWINIVLPRRQRGGGRAGGAPAAAGKSQEINGWNSLCQFGFVDSDQCIPVHVRRYAVAGIEKSAGQNKALAPSGLKRVNDGY
jgi:hypothetical protein